MSIILRRNKGSELTWDELDGNFAALQDSGNASFLAAGTGALQTTVQEELRHFVYVTQFGAACDGVTDDTAAWAAAVASLGSGGGEIRFPAGTRSKGNIVITAQNIRFKSSSFSPNANLNMQLVPAVLASPVISVGDGTTRCDGFQTYGIVLEGSGTGAIGLKINGAAVCSYRNFSSQGFTDAAVRITSSATQPSYFQFFDGFDIAADASAASIALDVDYGSQYATGLYFSNGTLGCQSGGLWALQVNESTVDLSNVWIQVAVTGTGINLKSTGGTIGKINASNVTVDSNASTDVLLNMDQDTAINTAIHGSITIDGKCTMPAGTSSALTGQRFAGVGQSMWFPRNIGALYLIDSTTPYLAYDATDITASLSRTGSTVSLISPGVLAAVHSAGQLFDVQCAGQAGIRLNNTISGAKTQVQQAQAILSSLSGASATASNLVPAGSIILGVTVRVTSVITGATSFDIGDGSDVDAFGATIAVASGTTTTLANSTITTPQIHTAATSIVLTANGSNFTAGQVRIIAHYVTLTAPTS